MKVDFVEFIPEVLEEGILYISMKYKAARHKCACGCGNVVITPITPTDWQIKYNGRGITLSPSIGNWNFECQSHYWIVCSEIRWSNKWTRKQIEAGRLTDATRKQKHFTSLRKFSLSSLLEKFSVFKNIAQRSITSFV